MPLAKGAGLFDWIRVGISISASGIFVGAAAGVVTAALVVVITSMAQTSRVKLRHKEP